jgi:integrase
MMTDNQSVSTHTTATFRTLRRIVVHPTLAPSTERSRTSPPRADHYVRETSFPETEAEVFDVGGRRGTRTTPRPLVRWLLPWSAVDEEVIAANPVLIRGAGVSKRQRSIEPASLPQLATITAAMPERLRLAVLLACWCALRYGEMAELRRSDIDFDRGVIKVRRGAVWLKGRTISGPPKTAAGALDVAFPPHLAPTIREHLATHAQ